MEKVRRKSTVKTSPTPLSNFGKLPNAANGCKIVKNKKSLELVINFFELQSIFRKVHFLVWSFEFGNWKEKEKSNKTLNISQERKFPFRGNKNHFS